VCLLKSFMAQADSSPIHRPHAAYIFSSPRSGFCKPVFDKIRQLSSLMHVLPHGIALHSLNQEIINLLHYRRHWIVPIIEEPYEFLNVLVGFLISLLLFIPINMG
jgi:hypothetical protein